MVGDCKMSALSTRAAIGQAGQYYLAPLAQVGEMAELVSTWVKEGLAKEATLCKVIIQDADGTARKITRGYEVERTCRDGEHNWQERVLVVQSFAYAEKERHHVEERLGKAEAALRPLDGGNDRSARKQTWKARLRPSSRSIGSQVC